MTKFDQLIENAKHCLNNPLPDRKRAIEFYMMALDETNDIAKKAIITNEINKLRSELGIKVIYEN